MTLLRSYRDLEVWQKAMSWIEQVYSCSLSFPADERFGLTSQLRRAAVSVAANIAEGAERSGTGEFLQFLGIASGSLAEAETLILLAHRLRLVSQEDQELLIAKASEIGRMIEGLKRSLRQRLKNGNSQGTPRGSAITAERSLTTITGHRPPTTDH